MRASCRANLRLSCFMNTRSPSAVEPLESRIAPAIIYALTSTNSLLVLDSDTPGTIDATLPITGLAGGDSMRGIDFRPATGELFGFTVPAGSANNAIVKTYTINPVTGAATFIGQTAAGLPGAGDVPSGFDFNPTVDRMRLVNSGNENARLNPNNGALAGNDTDLTFTGPAVGPVIAEAYDRNFVHMGAGTTTLYGIDRAGNRLIVQGGVDGLVGSGPNGGVVTAVGPLGLTLSATRDGGMDIENSSGIAFAALTDNANNLTSLFTIDLTTGAATGVGLIGDGSVEIRSISIPTPTVTVRNATTATYLDPDGDTVTIKITKGDLNNATFAMAAASNGGGQLRFIDFNGLLEFQNSNLSVLVKKGKNGNGLADVGFIDATGLDLGVVSLRGDLGAIDAGDPTSSTPAIKSLAVQSVGRFGLETGAVDLNSNLVGSLGKLTVKSDFCGNLSITGGVDGNLGSVTIGGSLMGGTVDNTGRIDTTNNIGAIKIAGSIVAGTGNNTGRIGANKTILSLTIGGSLFVGTDVGSGRLDADKIGALKIGHDMFGLVQTIGDLGPTTIGGSIVGGDRSFSGGINVGNKLTSLKVMGSIKAGTASNTGNVEFISGNAVTHGAIFVGGDLQGGPSSSGSLFTKGKVTSITINGSIIGGSGGGSSGVVSGDEIVSLRVGRNLLGGSIGTGDANLTRSGAIEADRIGSLFVGGSVITGLDESAAGNLIRNAAISIDETLGAVTIRGSIIGRTGSGGATLAAIVARGVNALPTDTTNIAIKSLTVLGTVEQANILAGYTSGLSAVNGDAQIGKVTVGGNWIASNLVAGVQDDADAPLNDFFGDGDDQVATGVSATIVSRIGAIVIKGSVVGTSATGGDSFGFVAQQITSFSAGGIKATLTTGTDLPFRLPLNSFDVVVREVA